MQTTILVVEDHDTVRGLLREWLKVTFSKCQVEEAMSGEEAIDLTLKHDIDVVIMDIGLPGVGGIEATRCIKERDSDIDIVMLTIHEDNAYRAEAEMVGASAYVPKRKIQIELKPVLDRLLPKHRSAQDAC